ncbi:MAG: hypothetical protein LH679_09105 [Cyanobacteria bacterium CAN_BIN43]|nr:hypothetical protein [Cyanobacteria bacterium CAN_BIN43]
MPFLKGENPHRPAPGSVMKVDTGSPPFTSSTWVGQWQQDGRKAIAFLLRFLFKDEVLGRV